MTGPGRLRLAPSGLAYLREVLTRCGDVIDVLTWHVYPTDGTWDDDARWPPPRSVGDEIPLLRGWLTDPEVNPLGFERDIGLAITEFGLSWRTSMYRHLEDQTAALWLADALGQMATLGLDLGQYFALQSMGGHGLIDRGGWVRPTYHVYAMLAGFGGTATPSRGRRAPRRLRRRRRRHAAVLLVNRSDDDLEVTLDGRRPAATLAVATLDEAALRPRARPRRTVQPADRPSPCPPARSSSADPRRTLNRGGRLAPHPRRRHAHRTAPQLPPGFVWGVATASYQIEGAVAEDGRGRRSGTPSPPRPARSRTATPAPSPATTTTAGRTTSTSCSASACRRTASASPGRA
jgi:hypothetical protein